MSRRRLSGAQGTALGSYQVISRLHLEGSVFVLPFQAACIVGAGVVLGAAVTVSPLIAAAMAAGAFGLGLLTLERRLVTLFLVSLSLGLIGYMFLGRGFAYAGVPPLFIGEALLGLAVLCLVYTFSIRHFTFLHILVVLFIAWGFLRTAPFITTYGIDALRDAVVWGYALFALAIAIVVTPKVLQTMMSWYARLVPYFMVWVPVVAVTSFVGLVPAWPQSGVSIAEFKQGDIAVQVAGMIAFVVSGMYDAQRPNPKLQASIFWLLVIAGFGFVATSRAGTLTVLAGIGAAFFLWPTRQLVPFIAVMLVVGALVVAINPNFSVGGYSRQVGPQQIVENVNSLVGTSDSGNLQGTRKWREDWWGKVWGYTVDGSYFFGGKGFGVNLAVDDGFETFSDPPSRSPHNGHVTILARMGVPGLALWIAIQLMFGFSIFQAYLRARGAGALFWARLDTFILIYWMALLINMSFDVYLEGPQGGIWYWSVIGLGLAAIRIQRESLEEPIAPGVKS